MLIPEFGIIQMPPGCGVGADTWTLPASLWKALSVKHVDLIQPFIANLTELATENPTPTSATEKPMKMARSPWEIVVVSRRSHSTVTTDSSNHKQKQPQTVPTTNRNNRRQFQPQTETTASRSTLLILMALSTTSFHMSGVAASGTLEPTPEPTP